jgi:hypothetical protein
MPIPTTYLVPNPAVLHFVEQPTGAWRLGAVLVACAAYAIALGG